MGRRSTEVTRACAFFAQAKPCGAKTRTGRPCRAKGLPRTHRCKWHGGCSTGPKTPEGRARAMANLKQYRASLGQRADSLKVNLSTPRQLKAIVTTEGVVA
jgi:hypothetical protein